MSHRKRHMKPKLPKPLNIEERSVPMLTLPIKRSLNEAAHKLPRR